MKRTSRTLFLCLSLLCLGVLAVGQTVTVKTVGTGGDYATLKAAFDAINARSIEGAIELQIRSSIIDDNTAKLYGSGQIGEITITAGNGGSGYATGNTITFSTPEDPSGVAATGIVTAGTLGEITSIEITNPGSGYAAAPTIASTNGSGTGATPTVLIGGNYTSLDIYPITANVKLSGTINMIPVFRSIIDLIGADNVTIDGRVNRTGTTIGLTIESSQVSALSGLITGAYAYRARNGANDNTIRYVRLLADRWARVDLASTSNGKGVNNFLIENSIISTNGDISSRRQVGISLSGINAAARFTNITIKNNEFVNLFADQIYMITVENNPNILLIEGNHFYATRNFFSSEISNRYGIYVNTGSNVSIKGNYFGGSAKFLGGTALKYTVTGTNTVSTFTAISEGTCPSIVVENNQIGNIEITIAGIFAAIETSTSTATVKNNVIGDINSTNSIISNAPFYGIYSRVTGTTIEQNTIGGIQSNQNLAGITTTNVPGTGSISNNRIGNLTLKSNLNVQATQFAGIRVPSPNNWNIQGNYIYGLINEQSTSATGIDVSSPSNVTNNIIHLQPSTTGNTIGIRRTGTSAINIYNNTVSIDGSVSTGTTNTYAFFDNGSGTRNYRNNLFINAATNTGDASGKHYAASLLSTPTTINYNNYFVSGTGGVLGSFNSVDKTTLSDWQASTLQDCFSTSLNPNFPTPSGVATSNFLPTNVNLVATPISGFTTDYLGSTRDATNPAMGALEYTVTPSSAESTTTTVTTCGTYTWSANNTNYTESGTYTYTSGCNTLTLILTISSETVWYLDADGDGYYTGTGTTACTSPGEGYVTTGVQAGDCDDNDAAINPATIWYLDADGDGYYTGTGTTACTSPGQGYVTTGVQSGDCDDSDATKFASFNFYVDSDGDGFGTGTAVSVCAADANTAPAGYSTNNTDCDDTDATKNASFNFYVDSDGDGFGTGTAVSVCAADANTAPAGYSTNNTDCDDTDATKNASFNFYVDSDGDGFGTGTAVSVCAADANTAPAGYSTNSTDCDDTDATKNASFNFYVDSDGDGFGTGTAVSVCAADANTAPAGYSTNSTDCDDTNANKRGSFSFYLDSDGDGYGKGTAVSVCAVDANTPPAGYSSNNTDCAPNDATKWRSGLLFIDADNDGYTCGSMTVCYGATIPAGYRAAANGMDCNDKNANINPGKTEVCGNKIDDDCDGQVDEGCVVPCNFKTLTQSGWDATGSSSPLTNNWFATKFPAGLTIGGTGNTARFVKLTSAAAVRAMLPSSGVANILAQSWTNPTNTSVKNIFAGELVTLTLNIALNPELGNAKIKSGTYIHKTVNWLLAEANLKISSTTSKSTELKSLSDACSKVNSSFGKTKSGYVACDVYDPSSITSGTNNFSSTTLFEDVKGDGKLQLTVYPNPTNNYFNIRNNHTHSIQIRVMTLNGKVIEEVKSIQPGKIYQFGHNLIAGMYLVEVSENGNTTVQKIIKVG